VRPEMRRFLALVLLLAARHVGDHLESTGR
jgi:hypothetical protein